MGSKKRLAALLLCLFLLAGCQGKALPSGMEEEPLLTAGREVLLLVVGGDYEAVHERLRADQREAVSVEEVQSMALSALDGAGDYVEIQDSMVTGQSSDGESYGGTGVTVIPENKSSEAAAALAVLGYSQSEIGVALKGIDVDALSLEDVIKQALKKMVKN